MRLPLPTCLLILLFLQGLHAQDTGVLREVWTNLPGNGLAQSFGLAWLAVATMTRGA
jgi:hypothetical protein